MDFPTAPDLSSAEPPEAPWVRLGHEIRIERKSRHPVDIKTETSSAAGPATVTLVDLSEEGFKAATNATFEIGSYVKVLLPNSGWKLAQVRWALPGHFGARFEGSLKPRKLKASTPRPRPKAFGRSRPASNGEPGRKG